MLLPGFVKVVLCISRPLPNKTKLKFDREFKACWSFCFELKVLNESKYSMHWVCCAFVFRFTESYNKYRLRTWTGFVSTYTRVLKPNCKSLQNTDLHYDVLEDHRLRNNFAEDNLCKFGKWFPVWPRQVVDRPQERLPRWADAPPERAVTALERQFLTRLRSRGWTCLALTLSACVVILVACCELVGWIVWKYARDPPTWCHGLAHKGNG